MSDLSELKTKLAMSSRMLFNAGLVDYSGHISVRIPGSDHLLILPHPVSRATVKPDDMVITDFEGKLIEGKYKAPSEVNMHARAYKARSDIQSVAHFITIWWLPYRWSISHFTRQLRILAPFSGRGRYRNIWIRRLSIRSSKGTRWQKLWAMPMRLCCVGMVQWSWRMRSSGYLPAVSTWKKPQSRFYKASLLGPVLVYSEDETQRVMKRPAQRFRRAKSLGPQRRQNQAGRVDGRIFSHRAFRNTLADRISDLLALRLLRATAISVRLRAILSSGR